jgi:hypothetical protein
MAQIVIIGDLDEVAVEMELVGDLVGKSVFKTSPTEPVRQTSPEEENQSLYTF